MYYLCQVKYEINLVDLPATLPCAMWHRSKFRLQMVKSASMTIVLC